MRNPPHDQTQNDRGYNSLSTEPGNGRRNTEDRGRGLDLQMSLRMGGSQHSVTVVEAEVGRQVTFPISAPVGHGKMSNSSKDRFGNESQLGFRMVFVIIQHPDLLEKVSNFAKTAGAVALLAAPEKHEFESKEIIKLRENGFEVDLPVLLMTKREGSALLRDLRNKKIVSEVVVASVEPPGAISDADFDEVDRAFAPPSYVEVAKARSVVQTVTGTINIVTSLFGFSRLTFGFADRLKPFIQSDWTFDQSPFVEAMELQYKFWGSLNFSEMDKEIASVCKVRTSASSSFCCFFAWLDS